MTQTHIETPAAATTIGYVEWSAILAGAATALAVSFVLLTFGASVGLSSLSPWTSTATSIKAVTFGAAFWLLLVNIWAFAFGGYLAGRLRHRWIGAKQSEVEFRDGAHGLIVWAVAVTLGAIVAAGSVASVGRGAANAGGAVASAAGSDAFASSVDQLLRTTTEQPNAAASRDVRPELGRLLATSVAQGEIAAADRTYMAQLIAARTGIDQATAERRVTETIDKAKRAADTARKAAVVLGFLLAASMLVAGAAAWWGASVGGRHRDEGTIWQGLSRYQPYA